MRSGPEPKCNCAPCQTKRRIQRDYYAKNRRKVLAQNAKSKARQKERGVSSEVSDEEMDRRAIAMGVSAS